MTQTIPQQETALAVQSTPPVIVFDFDFEAAEAKERGWKFIHYCEGLPEKKTPLERLAIAGALIAAEIDRWEHAAGNQQ